MPTEADTCRMFVVPKLQVAGWDDEPHSIAEQRTITDGRIVPVGQGFIRKPPKRVDYLLRYTRDFPLAVVEAKAAYKTAADGMQQAKQYAEMLGLTFAHATNGHDILEFDYSTGWEISRVDYPTPGELWQRYRAASGLHDPQVADRVLTPCHSTVGRGERYYQSIAINRGVEAILKGQRRLLLTMATGTGKTLVAFQICWKLWTARWNRTGAYRRPKILYLADRNILVDQPKDGIFAAFGDARYKIESGEVVQSREMYFALYQALAEDERRIGLFNAFPPDFFDLVIVDECHRGSARDDSSWRLILEYFAPAVQLGMTATPLRDDNRDTYRYFGHSIYEYSLRQGIDDGFLAPYRCSAIIDNLHSNPRYAETGVPCVRSPDVGYGILDLEGALRTDETEYERRTVRGKPQPDDIVFVREGGGTGKCALVSPGQQFSLGQRVMMLRPNPEKILPRFFLHQLLSPLLQEAQILRLCLGSASPHLNIGALKRFRIRLPSLPEQGRIVAYLDGLQVKVDTLKRLQAETAAELNALLPAVLDHAFKGEL